MFCNILPQSKTNKHTHRGEEEKRSGHWNGFLPQLICPANDVLCGCAKNKKVFLAFAYQTAVYFTAQCFTNLTGPQITCLVCENT